MKKLIAIIMIIALLLPATVLADNPDPIVGAWYIMLNYNDMPYEDKSGSEGKNYMIYVMIFEDTGAISGISGESLQGIGFYGSGTPIGTWVNAGGKYTASVTGIGVINPAIEGDRLIVQMTTNVYYSMRRIEMGSWEDDLIIRY